MRNCPQGVGSPSVTGFTGTSGIVTPLRPTMAQAERQVHLAHRLPLHAAASEQW